VRQVSARDASGVRQDLQGEESRGHPERGMDVPTVGGTLCRVNTLAFFCSIRILSVFLFYIER
jgi:hypothetical protein